MAQKYIPPKDLSICSPYKFVGAAGEGCVPCARVFCGEALRFRKEVALGYRVTPRNRVTIGNRRIVTRTFKCATRITDISEADGSVQLPRSHWPLAPHPSRVFIIMDDQASEIAQRDLDDEELFDLYVFRKQDNEYALSYT